jgi:CHASE2 domain-containing sensor protein
MSGLESRLFFRSVTIGGIVTVAILIAGAIGLLNAPENWLYDQRAAHCQWMAAPPTTRIAHIDIDDGAIDVVGRWPWPRATLAGIIDEINRAHPRAVALDIFLSEPQPARLVRAPDGTIQTVDDDAQLAQSLKQGGDSVLAASFYLDSVDAPTPGLTHAVAWFMNDLEITPDLFRKKLAESRQNDLDNAAIDDLFVHAQRLAMKTRIDQELDKSPLTLAELIARLLPNTDTSVHSASLRMLENEYTISTAAHAISRFGVPVPVMSPAPVHGQLSVVPTATFTSVAAGCGITNYDIFKNATIRSVPLFAEYNNQLYPQMGLALACVMLGADPKAAKFDGSNVIIPAPGRTITIPTYSYHSGALDADVPLIAAIPWFGTADWQTMYDWPTHRSSAGHVSIVAVWGVYQALENIKINCANIDIAISNLLDNGGDRMGVDPALGAKFAALRPDPADFSAREAMAEQTLKAVNDYGIVDYYKTLADKDLTADDRLRRGVLNDSLKALNNGVASNRQLSALIDQTRRQLAEQIGGKGVLIGFTATGYLDKVNTSLHLNCPGVVIHGVIANAVLTGRWWHMAPWWITFILTVVFGLFTATAQGRLTPVRASLLALSLIIGYSFINGWILFGVMRWIVGLAGPIFVVATVWAAGTMHRVIFEAIERSRIATEVAIFSREMELAQQVQVALIPTKSPDIGGLQVEGWALAADLTGGDCYDFWQLQDGRLAVLLADASGHGLAPAMIVSQVRTLVRALSEFETHPHSLLARVNDRVSYDLEGSRFITAFLAFFSPDGTMHFASAGHGPMYWCPDNKSPMLELESTGLPLGIQAPWLADDIGPPVKLTASGMLAVFSDGLFEAPAPNGQQFGVERVRQILTDTRGEPCATIIASLRSAVQKWQTSTSPKDDQTVVIVRRIGPPTV